MRRRRRTAAAFLLPTFLAMAVLFLWPLWQALGMSLSTEESSLTAGNYIDLLTDTRFQHAAFVSLIYTVAVVGGSLAVGMGTALLLNRKVRGVAVLRSMFIMPWAMPFVATALIWRWMLDSQYGVLTYGIDALGGGTLPNPFSSNLALATVSVIEIWKTAPLAAIMLLAGMQAIPKELYESAAIDGANVWRRFLHVTLPGLRFTTRAVTLLLTLWIFGRAFMVIFLTTGGGPGGATETLVLLTYLKGFNQFDLHSATATGMVTLAIALILTVGYRRAANDGDD
ncbi:carbohydrate ABC transporter permease [Plantactinospora sp. GCM10030261]|uniref:carbohydrate ABC transporter permease n=1 Tax=Plantactinospora sp. GCM10030261 TaxID=3273420 RepID=UPI00361F8CB9